MFSIHFGLEKILPIIFYGVGILIVLIAIFRDVKFPLLFLVALFPLENLTTRIHQFPLGKDFIDILLISIIIGWFSKKSSKQKEAVTGTLVNKVIVFIMIYTYISLWLGSIVNSLPLPIDISGSRLQLWKNYMILPLIYFITVNNIKDKKWIEIFTWGICFIIFIMGFQFIRNYKGVDTSAFSYGIRKVGTFVSLGPNEYAAFHTHYLFVLLGVFLLDKKIIRKMFFALTIGFSLYCIIFLYSRGAYLGVLIGLVFLLFIRSKVLLIVLLLSLFSWQTILPPSVTQRITMTKTEEGELEHSSEARIEMWKQSMDLFEKNPAMGMGFNTIPYFGLILGDTHNIYVKLLAEQGIIGLLLILMLLGLSFKAGWKLYQTSQDNFLKGLGIGFSACIIAMVVTNFFGDRWTYVQVGVYYWVFLGCVMRGNIITQEENNVARLQNEHTITNK